jgi:hypothetical protein
MFSENQTTGQGPRPKCLLAYIHSYINGHGRPWTSSDPNLKIRPGPGQFAGSCGVLLPTTEQKAFVAGGLGLPNDTDNVADQTEPRSVITLVVQGALFQGALRIIQALVNCDCAGAPT